MVNMPFGFLTPFPFTIVAVILVALIYWVPSFFVVYHLVRFGVGKRPKILALIFMIGSVILFSIFVLVISQANISDVSLKMGDYFINPLQ